jgi:hypothetical protein
VESGFLDCVFCNNIDDLHASVVSNRLDMNAASGQRSLQGGIQHLPTANLLLLGICTALRKYKKAFGQE